MTSVTVHVHKSQRPWFIATPPSLSRETKVLTCVGFRVTVIKDFGGCDPLFQIHQSSGVNIVLNRGQQGYLLHSGHLLITMLTPVHNIKNTMGFKVCIFVLLSPVVQMAVSLSETLHNDTMLTKISAYRSQNTNLHPLVSSGSPVSQCQRSRAAASVYTETPSFPQHIVRSLWWRLANGRGMHSAEDDASHCGSTTGPPGSPLGENLSF